MGMALNVHYCEGEVSSVSLAYRLEEPCSNHENDKTKACCGVNDATHKSCCKNDLVKLQDDKASDNIIVKSLQLDLSTFCIVEEWKPLQFAVDTPILTSQNPSFYCDSHAPPLFKLYCQYIFYA
jgi:hypothetical protein